MQGEKELAFPCVVFARDVHIVDLRVADVDGSVKYHRLRKVLAS